MTVLTFVAVNALTDKVQQLESQLAENIASNLMDNSANADLEHAPTTGDQEYQEEAVDDNETIEEEPNLFSSGGDDLFSESDEQTDTEDNFTEKKANVLPQKVTRRYYCICHKNNMYIEQGCLPKYLLWLMFKACTELLVTHEDLDVHND